MPLRLIGSVLLLLHRAPTFSCTSVLRKPISGMVHIWKEVSGHAMNSDFLWDSLCISHIKVVQASMYGYWQVLIAAVYCCLCVVSLGHLVYALTREGCH